MSIPEYLVSRSSLRTNRPDALIADEIVVVTKADHVAAVEAVREKYGYTDKMVDALCDDARTDGYKEGREQAISDCIAVADRSSWDPRHTMISLLALNDLLAVLRALLVKGLKNSAETTDGAE